MNRILHFIDRAIESWAFIIAAWAALLLGGVL